MAAMILTVIGSEGQSNGRIGFALVILAVIGLLSEAFARESNQGIKPTGVLSTLKIGQAFNLKEVSDRYLVTVIEGENKLPQSHKVLEIGAEFLVAEDFTELNQIRIPLTSIKAVVHFKGFKK